MIRRGLQDVLIRANMFVLLINLQDIFKTSCQNLFETFCKNIFKISSKRPGKMKDVFKNVFVSSS